MFCIFCGKEISDESAFCRHCGANLSVPAVAAPPRYTAPPVPQKKPVNGFGIAAFVIGIITLLFGFFYIFFVAVVGIVLGSIGVARRKHYSLNGLAIAGLVLSCVALVLWAIVWFVLMYYFAVGLFLLFLIPLIAMGG